jgi:hypothetical protein
MTSIGFGGGEVIQVDMKLSEVRELLQQGLTERQMVQFEALNGETVVINPEQVKVLQKSGDPERFPPLDDRDHAAYSQN